MFILTISKTQMFAQTIETLLRGITQGLHLGAQLYISQNGKPLLDTALGEALPGIPMTPNSITVWWSSVKPITAIAIAQLYEQNKLALDDRVAKHIPEFAAAGKEAITIRHLLTHTGGFRAWPTSIEPFAPWDKIIAGLCATKIEPGWIPGQKAGYHPRTSWSILGELIRRLDGRPCDQYVREEIFAPLSMNDSWLSFPANQYHEYIRSNRLAVMRDSSRPSASGVFTEAEAAECHPGYSGRGPIRELARFYEMLLNNGSLNSAQIISPKTVELFTTPQRIGMFDNTFKHIMDWSLGFITNSAQYGVDTVPYGYGPHASPRTFGHSGSQSSCAFCDPENKLVVAWLCNGMPGEPKHQQRQRAINTAIYQDLLPL
jgi:CubicO group peptidase (beta-lactamase class C family)